jgi:hypothetical protein
MNRVSAHWEDRRTDVIDVVEGICAVKVGCYWVGVAEGNHYSRYKRRTAERALKDAQAILDAKERPNNAR